MIDPGIQLVKDQCALMPSNTAGAGEETVGDGEAQWIGAGRTGAGIAVAGIAAVASVEGV